jgi:hypothetical protein
MRNQGKNGKHANQDRRRKAEENCVEAEGLLKKARSKPNKTHSDNEYIKKLERQVKKFRKDKSYNGEHHSQKGKGC